MIKIFRVFWPVVLSLGLLACASSGTGPATFSDAQRRAMQVKTHDASYDMVFYAVKSVLLDDGYIIKSQDYAGGMILAEGSQLKLPAGRANPSSTGSADSDDSGISTGGVLLGVGLFALAIAAGGGHSNGGSNGDRSKVGSTYQISFNFDKINSKITETRLIVQERTQYNMGNETFEEHIKPEIYKHLYDRINHEIKRREAMGR